MNPEQQNTNQQAPSPEQVNPTAHAYNNVASESRGKKFVIVTFLILLGVIALVVLVVIAYNSTGERTENKIEDLNEDVGSPIENPDIPSAQ